MAWSGAKMKEKQSLEVNLLEIRRINKSGDLIGIWFMLINATMDLIEEKSKFENQLASRLQ
jgi:hypothetical protein